MSGKERDCEKGEERKKGEGIEEDKGKHEVKWHRLLKLLDGARERRNR